MKIVKSYLVDLQNQRVAMPGLVRVLSAEMQGSKAAIRVISDNEDMEVTYMNLIILKDRSNADAVEEYEFLGTVRMTDDQFMWHVFYELIEIEKPAPAPKVAPTISKVAPDSPLDGGKPKNDNAEPKK